MQKLYGFESLLVDNPKQARELAVKVVDILMIIRVICKVD